MPGVLQDVGHRLCGQGVAVAAHHQGIGASVAVDHGAVLVAQHDAPVYTITYYAQWRLMQAVHEAGYKVSVSGTGAGTWSAAATPTGARNLHTATLLSTGKVLVAGGANTGAVLATASLYDPTGTGTGSWSAAGTMVSVAGASAAASLVGVSSAIYSAFTG